MLVAAYLLLTTAVTTLNEVPALDELPRPDYNFSLPDLDLPSNPEMTNLQAPELDLGNVDPEPLLSILGKTGTEYLRLQTYDDYFSGTWDTSLTDSITYEGETLNLDVDLWTDFNQYNITITPLTDTMGYIPTPSNPLSLNLSNPAQFFEDQQIFQVPDVPGAYEVEYMLYEYSDALKNASNVENIPQYLDVPEYLDSDLKNLAEAITQNTTTDYEAITALESYLENYYDYNLSCPEPPPGTDPLEYFLYESGEGVCSHFNTALVMLARSLDFSARLVGGYYIDPLADEQLVYPIQSHAFTEIPFDDLGWIIFDATPPAQIQDMIDEIPDMNLSDLGGSLDDLDFEFPEGENPPQERLFRIYGKTGSPYLRDGVGEYYNGTWYQNPALPIEYKGHIIESLITGYEDETENSFIVEPSLTFNGYLPGPQDPVQLDIDVNSTYYPELKLFKPDQPHSTRYQVSGNTYTFTSDTLTNADPYLLEPYLQIDETLDSRINAIASDVTRYELTPYAKVNALKGYLQTSFPYNISAQPEPPDVDPVVWFLFYEQQGICTDFASALTMLTRSIGIPARLVTGYLVNPDAEVQDVTSMQAHAYTEVLFDDLGWIIFDATPIAGPQVIDPTGLTPTFTNITHQDSTVNVGGEFTVAGTVIDDLAQPVSGLEILVYLKQAKTDPGMLSGQGVLIDGLFNITCLFPPNLPAGEYMVDAHTIGDDTYLDSWSDPPLTAFSETSFIIQAPPRVIAGRTYSVNATLVDHNTNRTIPLADCVATVNDNDFNLKTNQQGTLNLGTSSDEGPVTLEFSWPGTGYILGADTARIITSVPLQVGLPAETVLVRGERNIIRGQIKAEEMVGDLEPLSMSILGDNINSVTNEHGEFFIAKTVPDSTELGATPLVFEILNDHRSSTEFAVVKSRVHMMLETPVSGEADKKTGVKVTLTDDKGTPLASQPVNITYNHQNTTFNKEIFTDSTGIAETEIKLPPKSGRVEVNANYPGKTNYIASSTSQTVSIISPTKFPLLQLSALILLIGGVAGIFYLRDQRQTKLVEIEDMELISQAWSNQLSITLPEIEPDLPAVWDHETPLTIQGICSHEDQTPRTAETLSLLLNENVISNKSSDLEGKIRHEETVSTLGIHRLTLVHATEELRTGLDVKIVEYRDEIIRLFNNRFKESREMFQTIRDNYTARELYEYLKQETPDAAHEPLRELVFIFEEANYSLHEVKREHYTRFFREMRRYKEALNGEDS
jgi:transglutaminase-like putative cysteine protease